jgi:hypothetical protein
MFRDWLLLYAKIYNSELPMAACQCPECGAQTIDLQYIGKLDTRRGYFLMWCDTCRRGINGCRVRVPENVEMLSFDVPKEIFTARIPEFKLVDPD